MQLTVVGKKPVGGIWNRLDPRSKIVCVLCLSILIAMTPGSNYLKFLVYLGLVTGLGIVARVPVKRYLLRLLFLVPMLIFLVAAQLLFSGKAMEENLYIISGLLMKTFLIFSAVGVLVTTVQLYSIIKSLEKMKVPVIFTTMMAFAYRYVHLFRREAERMATARKSRSFGRKRKWSERKDTLKIVPVFIFRVLERSRRIYAAMLSRGGTEKSRLFYRTEAMRFTWRDGLFGGVFGSIIALMVVI
jgi:cobalt/nickel transport system permease protein